MESRSQQTNSTVKDSYKVIVSETGYDLTEMPSVPGELKPRTIYFRISPQGLNYKVLGQDGKPKDGTILRKHLPSSFPKTKEGILQFKNSSLKTILQQTVKAGHTKKESVVYIAKEAVPPELNTYLYVAESKEAMEKMIKAGTIKHKGVVLVGEGLSRTAYFIKNGALVTKKMAEGNQAVLAIPDIKVPEEEQLNWSPTYSSELIGKSSDSSKIESIIDNAIKAAGKPAPLPLGKDRYYLRDLFLQNASMALVAAPTSISGESYYIGVIERNSKDKYELFFDNFGTALSSSHHPFRVDATPDENMTASVVKTEKINLVRGNERQVLLERQAKKFSELREKAIQKTQIPLEVEEKDEAKEIAAREDNEKAELEEAKKFFDLSQEELALFNTASAKFIKDMKKCDGTIVSLEKEVEKSLDFPQPQSELVERLEKKMGAKKEELSKLMTAAQERIAIEMNFNLRQLQAQKDQEFKEYLLTMHKQVQQAILSDAVIRNSMENAIRNTLSKYNGKDKQYIIEILKENNLLKDAEDIIFNSPLTTKQLIKSVNTIFDKLKTYVGSEHPYRVALRSILEKNFTGSMQHKKEILIFEKDTFEINANILAESRKLAIATYKENVRIKRRDGTVTLDEIHQQTTQEVARLQQAQKEYLAAIEKERDDFTNITKNRTAILEKEKSMLVEINELLEQVKEEQKKAANLLDQNNQYQYSLVPHQLSAWQEASTRYAQIGFSIQELTTLRREFKEQAQSLSNAANNKDISLEESKKLVSEIEKTASTVMLNCSTKLTIVKRASAQASHVIEKVKIEDAQQKIFNLLRDTLMGEGQVDYWNEQRIMGGTKITDKQGKTQTVPTGIGKMFLAISALKLKEGTISDIQSSLESCGEEAKDRLNRKSFLGKKIGRQDTTTEIYTLIKDVKDNLHNPKELEKLFTKLQSSKAYVHYQEQQKQREKLSKEMHNGHEIR